MTNNRIWITIVYSPSGTHMICINPGLQSHKSQSITEHRGLHT